eukprot:197925_1
MDAVSPVSSEEGAPIPNVSRKGGDLKVDTHKETPRISDLEASVSRLEKRLTLAQSARDSTVQENRDLTSKNADLLKSVSVLKQRVLKLEDSCETLSKREIFVLDRLQTIEKYREKRRISNNISREEHLREVTSYETQLQRNAEELVSLQGQLTDSVAQLERTQTDKTACDDEIKQLYVELSNLEVYKSDYKRFTKICEDQKEQLEKARIQVSECKATECHLETRLKSCEEQITFLNNKLSQASKDRIEQFEEITALKLSLSEAISVRDKIIASRQDDLTKAETAESRSLKLGRVRDRLSAKLSETRNVASLKEKFLAWRFNAAQQRILFARMIHAHQQ